MHEITDLIHQHSIADIIGRYITLKKTGANYKAQCPFHDEKTASFHVSESKGIFKCFGCGKAGDAITFVQEYNKQSFIEAVREIAGILNLEMPQINKQAQIEYETKQKKIGALRIVNEMALDHWHNNLDNAKDDVIDYIKSRIRNKDMINLFEVCYADNSFSTLKKHASDNGYKTDILLEAGILKQSDKDKTKIYDRFRDRMIFPVRDYKNILVGFSGRSIKNNDTKAPKYINSPETKLYIKGNHFFGLNHSHKYITQQNRAVLVEGNTDTVNLFGADIKNVVGKLGTSLTNNQVELLKRFCDNVLIINDGDDAGRKANISDGKKFFAAGFQVEVSELNEGDDPDSLFTDKKVFDEYITNNTQDYILYYAANKFKDANTPHKRSTALNKVCDVLMSIDDQSVINQYISELSNIHLSKKDWTDRIRYLQGKNKNDDKISVIPKDVSLDDFERYGFYEYNNSYYFKTQKGILKGSNFVLKPLFHVISTMNAKRLYEIINEHNYSQIIELHQKDLVALSRFKERVESLGNYIWYGSENELNRLKGFLYEKTETCKEITQLGWHKDGFFAWGNGIYNGNFTEVDKYGIVRHTDNNYYIPAFSKVYESEESLFTSERRFIHMHGDVSLYDYAALLIQVFDNNAAVALCYYFATLFRDYLINKFNFFPILNLFGPKGAGKTELAVSMLQFFGRQPKGPNINSTSKAALADHVAQVSNALVHIDEYKNNLDFEKIEFLKGLWDGTGRTRMNMDKDKKKETTAVDCGVITSGQEMPTSDIALFSRLIFITFHKCEYNEEEKELFNTLKKTEKKGLTHITEEILQYRSHFIKNFDDAYKKAHDDVTKMIDGEIIEDRIFKNWMMIIASYATIKDKLHLPFEYEHLLKLSEQQIRIQNKETKRSNEITQFWEIVEYLANEGMILENVDYKFDHKNIIKTDKYNMNLQEPIEVIYINHSRIFALYRKQGNQMKINVLPIKTLEYYLQNDKRYLGRSTQRFKTTIPGTTQIDEGSSVTREGKTKAVKCYCFNYSQLKEDISLQVDDNVEAQELTFN